MRRGPAGRDFRPGHRAFRTPVPGGIQRVAHASDAEDVVQETFLRVLKHRKKLATVENRRVWLIRIAWNLALDRKRRLRTTPLIEEAEEILSNRPNDETAADITLSAADGCARIYRLMDQLPRKEREVLRLSAIEELGTREIAAILQMTESAFAPASFGHGRDCENAWRWKKGDGSHEA